MQETLIKKGFLKWLESLDVAPYAVMFFDIPKFIQHSYIQKWLREVHDIHFAILPKMLPSNEIKYYAFKGKIKKDFNDLYDSYEKALEVELQKALTLIPGKDV
jgi:hypothetical protein